MPYGRIDDPEKLRRLLTAVLMISADVDLPELLRHFVEEAKSLVGARYAALGVLNPARTGLEQFITTGMTDAETEVIGLRPTGRGVLGLLISDPRPLRLSHLGESPSRAGFPPDHPTMDSFLGVPVRVRDDVYGNLYLTDKVRGGEFSDEDEALAEALALAAGVAIENFRLHDKVRAISVLDDRDRIARDLHDRVIQRVYAVGMGLQGAVRLQDQDALVERVERAVDELDATIGEIRGAIFELGDPSLPGGLRQAVIRLVDELAPILGSRPVVRFEGPIDTSVPDSVGEHVLAVVREGLTNAGRHAQATKFAVEIRAIDDLVVEVIDNGRGLGSSQSAGLGLANVADRAEEVGGTFEVRDAPTGGTRLIWRVPL